MNFFLKLLKITLTIIITTTNCHESYRVPNWKFHFIPGTTMGLFVAAAIPLELPNKNIYMAYNFEANYQIPGNETFYEYPPLIQRRIDRKLIYSALETKMQSNGYPGRACLLRTICETSQHPMHHVNGVLGDILHLIFTPSTSRNGDLVSEYEEAEKLGKANNCVKYNKNCTVSFLDLISWIGKSI